jgi:hypothetical protein
MKVDPLAESSSLPVAHQGTISKRPRRYRFVIDDLIRICSRTVLHPAFALLVPAAAVLSTRREWLSWDALVRRDLVDVKNAVQGSRTVSISLWYLGSVVVACEQSCCKCSISTVNCLPALYSKLNYAYDQRVKPFHRPEPLKWSEEIIVITGGVS